MFALLLPHQPHDSNFENASPVPQASEPGAWRKARRPALIALVFLTVMGLLVASYAQAAPLMSAPDPFAGDIWHAVEGSWPGTIQFDAKTHKVVLQPMGSAAIHATYAYTVNPADKVRKGAASAPKEGTLTMTNTAGQVSQSDYRLDGRELTLTFREGLNLAVEHYKRMTKAEEEAEKQRIQKLLREGKLPNLR